MFDHVSIGVADIARSKKFYDAALKPLGYSRLSDGETSVGYGDKAVALWLGASQKPVKADMESGLHFCFVAGTAPRSMRFHAAALKAGGTDNGKPGLRADYGPKYYAALRHRSRRLPHRNSLRRFLIMPDIGKTFPP